MGFAALYPSYELRPTNFAPFLCILCGPDAKGCSEQVDLGRVAQQPTRDPSMTQMTFGDAERSEEHTSELQSLMRISYAVFCLKKKKTNNKKTKNTTYNNKKHESLTTHSRMKQHYN